MVGIGSWLIREIELRSLRKTISHELAEKKMSCFDRPQETS